ncbi:MAG: chorismate synthase [Parasporobacterium sp.]|nr:chorismate synthase [Parasporobacterium sp.]
MSSSYGENIKINIFGQSHSPAIGVTVEGIPGGKVIDMDRLSEFMRRRAPGQNEYSTPRKEKDIPDFISGIVGNTTCGVPLTALIYNTDTRSKDYSELKIKPRPGHADYTAEVRYNGAQDFAGGGHFSGRLTAPLCIAGGIVKQLLEAEGIEVRARIYSIAGVRDQGDFTETLDKKPFPTVSDAQGELMRQRIAEARADGDSVGGIVECIVDHIPAGLGDPMFGGMENRISSIVFGIPAVKGIEFGIGFEAAELTGSQNNDPFDIENGRVVTVGNNAGGIAGGITNGMPIVFRVAFKPTPSIGKEQQTVDLTKMEKTVLRVHGRHDPCIVPRAVPCVEAAAAIAVYDALLGYKKGLD